MSLKKRMSILQDYTTCIYIGDKSTNMPHKYSTLSHLKWSEQTFANSRRRSSHAHALYVQHAHDSPGSEEHCRHCVQTDRKMSIRVDVIQIQTKWGHADDVECR